MWPNEQRSTPTTALIDKRVKLDTRGLGVPSVQRVMRGREGVDVLFTHLHCLNTCVQMVWSSVCHLSTFQDPITHSVIVFK